MRDTGRTRALLALLLLVSFLLITLDVRGGITSPVAPLRAAASQAFGPVQRVAAAVVNPVARAVEEVRRLGDSDAELERLRRENDALRLELRGSEVTRARAAELDALLKVAGLGQYRVVPARVISLGPAQGFASTVTVDAGSRDGLTANMAVVNGQGLVGRVKTVGLLTATVLVVDDPTFAVGVRAEGTLEAGFATGAGQGPMELTMLNPQVRLEAGDRLVTRGSRDNAPFAPGIPVGEVASLSSAPGTLTRVGTVTPFVDIDAIELVGIIVEPPREDPRDSVLPPRPPAPAPAPALAPASAPAPMGG
jgi:rod shape-determining protein MreC